MIWKAIGFRDMLAIASVICALCARGTPSPYVANKIPHGFEELYHDTVRCLYHAPSGAYHEFRKEFYITAHSAYITRRKALYHVALSRETNDRFDMGGDSKRSQNGRKMGVVIP